MKEKYKPALAYEFLTPIYDAFNGVLGFGKNFERKVIQVAEIKEGDKILDVGMGTGTLISEAVKQYSKIEMTGIDPDKNILERAEAKLRKLDKEARLVNAYAQEMPFRDKEFDLAISVLVFHHMSTEVKKKSLQEIHRVLKEDGRFLLVDFGKPQTLTAKTLLTIGSIFDGRENLRANMSGMIPGLLKDTGFRVKEVAARYRGIQFLMGTKE